MKKYIMAIAAVSLFLSTQIIPMDRKNSQESIQRFKTFLQSKASAQEDELLDDTYMNLDYDTLIEWKEHILDNTRRLGISYDQAKEIFIPTIKNILINYMLSQFPEEDQQSLEFWYNLNIFSDVKYAADVIFNPKRAL